MVRLEHVLESWKTVRADTINAVVDFPDGELEYRPAADVLTFGEIARHIVDASDGLTGMLLAGEHNFATPDFRERLKQHMRPVGPGAAGLVAALRESIDQRTAELAAQPAEFPARMITRMDGQQMTVLEMLQFVKEHELTHRAQMFLYLRMKGIVPATTRRRLAKTGGR